VVRVKAAVARATVAAVKAVERVTAAAMT